MPDFDDVAGSTAAPPVPVLSTCHPPEGCVKADVTIHPASTRSAHQDGPRAGEDLNKPSSPPVYPRGSDNRGGGVDHVLSCPPRPDSGGRADLCRHAGDGVWFFPHGTKCGATCAVHHHVDCRSDDDGSGRRHCDIDCRRHQLVVSAGEPGDDASGRLGEHEVGTGIDRHRPIAGVPCNVSPAHHGVPAAHDSAAHHNRSRRPDAHSPPIGHSGLIQHELELWRHPHR